jgi:ubiquitin thioesterase protein OTUB1
MSNNTAVDPAELHRQQEARLAEIEQQVKEQQPLTSQRVPLTSLHAQYAENTPFIQGLVALERKYSAMRQVRGDGNCFYRAFLYSIAEQLLLQQHDTTTTTTTKRAAFIETRLDSNWKLVLDTGYDELTLEIFYETTRDFIHNLSSAETLHDDLSQENAVSDYSTWFLRVITATHLKRHADRFLPFIINNSSSSDSCCLDMEQFCARNVEPMNQECDQVQVMALAEAMKCQVTIEYVDGRHEGDNVIAHTFGQEEEEEEEEEEGEYHVHLLYRPGHYDILYPK